MFFTDFMKIKTAQFIKSAPDLASCPESPLGEVAFIGRSNVGKSTLVNFLAARKGLARVSQTPGHTTLINFFCMNDAWTMVDLPGYGYAKRSRENRSKFNEFVSDYLVNRSNLLGVFILIDSRIPPQTLDLDFIEWIVNCKIRRKIPFRRTGNTYCMDAWVQVPDKKPESSIKGKNDIDVELSVILGAFVNSQMSSATAKISPLFFFYPGIISCAFSKGRSV